jgi:hypothetical protein
VRLHTGAESAITYVRGDLLMRPKFLLSAVIAVAVLGMALPAGAATPINGTGHVSCSITGTIKFNPALTLAGGGPGHVTLKAKLTGCSGTLNGAHVASGSASGTETTTDHTCGDLAGPQSNTLTSTVKWKAQTGQPKLNPTTVVYTTETGNTGPPVSFDASGSATAGSFKDTTAGSATAHAIITETTATILGACGKKGVKTLHIGSGTAAIV